MDDDEMFDDGDDGLEYEDPPDAEEVPEIENEYYIAKSNIEEDAEEALKGFKNVVKLQSGEKGKWGFKSLKRMVKLLFTMKRYKEMLEAYKEQLTYTKSAVTRNVSEKAINKLLDFVSTSDNWELLLQVYETTLESLRDANNEKLWFTTNRRLGEVCYQMQDYGRLGKILKDLHKSCQLEDGTDDSKKGTQLLEVYALEIQMYATQKNNKKIKEVYNKALNIKSAIPHPKFMGAIRESGGKMHMAEREWEKSHVDFFEAFKNYDEAGTPRRIQCLKYVVLANMLMSSDINPFDSPEAKPYKNDPEILVMTSLLTAKQRNEIREFERVLKDNRKTIMDDPFIRDYIPDLLIIIRTQVLIKIIQPYTSIRIPFISKELNILDKDVEALLVTLILDNKVPGRIDQVNQILELRDKSKGIFKYEAISKWTNQLSVLQNTVINRLGF